MLHCKAMGCSTPIGDECDTKRPDGSDSIMWYYDYQVDEVKKRLKAAGLKAPARAGRQGQSGESGTSCPNSAQHYQDAYESAGRVSDLVCMQKALARELQ